MNIGIADNSTLKFTRDLKEHWEKNHEVRYEIGASEEIAQWADVYYVEWFDNNIHYLFNWYKEHPEAKKPRFAVRAIDWDIWVRGVRDQGIVDWVDHWICIAPHMEEWLRHEKDDRNGELIQWGDKLRLIQPGVNTDRFTLKSSQTDGFQLGMVLGDMWWYKNHMGGLDIFKTLYDQDNRYRFHIRGQHEGGQYNPVMYDHYLESRGIKDVVTLYGPQDDMNEWYEKVDILLHPGMKETFCYAVAESLCKGTPVVCNEFYGSEKIWLSSMLYKTHEEAVEKIHNLTQKDVDHKQIRDFALNTYGLEKYFKETNEHLRVT